MQKVMPPSDPNSLPPPQEVERVGVYRRRMPVSLERMLENALDWEHLPWLHSASFESIELETSDRWHWRAQARLVGTDQPTQLELRLHEDRLGWTTNTLAGAGAGTSIYTRLELHGERDLEIVVDFLVPGITSSGQRTAVGAFYLELYERLYDEDEWMMTVRQRRLDATPAAEERIDLGPADSLTKRLPLVVNTPRGPFRVLEHAGSILVHATVCPHRLGPLENCSLGGTRDAPELICPWHGYRFNARTGRSSEGRRMRLALAPRVHENEDGRAQLVWPSDDERS